MNRTRAVSLAVLITVLFPGCVVTQYKNDKGQECTRKYFTPFGIPFHDCSGTTSAVAAPEVTGEEFYVAPAAPAPSLRETTPAKTIEQNIRTTTQAR
jgi:hypothetical protein